jgi:hypothetical protein
MGLAEVVEEVCPMEEDEHPACQEDPRVVSSDVSAGTKERRDKEERGKRRETDTISKAHGSLHLRGALTTLLAMTKDDKGTLELGAS